MGIPGEIWQRGFSDEYVANEAAFRAQPLHIDQNAVRARLTRVPEEYQYGSAGSGTETDSIPEHLRG